MLAGVDLTGRLAVVTGGYSGLGLETTRALAAAGAHVVVPARRPGPAREALAGIDGVEVDGVDLGDLGDLVSVRAFADRFLTSGRSIDIVIDNAGIMACPEARVGPGWESQFGTNHLGHYALVNLLWPAIAAGSGARVVAVSSRGHNRSPIRWDDVQFEQGYDKWAAYGQAKTANILFAVRSIAARSAGSGKGSAGSCSPFRDRGDWLETMTSLDSYITLGRSGLRVSPLTLGAMAFGEDLGWGASPEVSAEIIAEYLDRGGNSIDTANLYTIGHSEKIVGDFFAKSDVRRDQAVIGTKFYCSMFDGDPNGGGGGRKAMVQQVEASLRRLQMDYVDILWLHNWDRGAPIEETLRGLDDLVTSGKTRYIAFSDLPAWKVAQAQTIAAFRGWSPIVALQLEYSLLQRTVEGELTPMAQELGIGVMPWSPLKSGFLSGRYRRDNAGSVESARPRASSGPSEADYVVIDALLTVADDVGASPAAVALAWVQGRPGVSSTVIGPRRVDQLVDDLGGLEVTLTDDDVAALDAVSTPTLDFPAPLREVSRAVGFPGTTIDGVQTPESAMLAMSSTRY